MCFARSKRSNLSHVVLASAAYDATPHTLVGLGGGTFFILFASPSISNVLRLDGQHTITFFVQTKHY